MSGDAKKLLYGSGLKVKLLVEKLEVASHVHLLMTPPCPVCADPMKQNGCSFHCEPSRQFVIFLKHPNNSLYQKEVSLAETLSILGGFSVSSFSA
jgi:tRNA(Ile2) C34 agmatinyltransferase TiaS